MNNKIITKSIINYLWLFHTAWSAYLALPKSRAGLAAKIAPLSSSLFQSCYLIDSLPWADKVYFQTMDSLKMSSVVQCSKKQRGKPMFKNLAQWTQDWACGWLLIMDSQSQIWAMGCFRVQTERLGWGWSMICLWSAFKKKVCFIVKGTYSIELAHFSSSFYRERNRGLHFHSNHSSATWTSG